MIQILALAVALAAPVSTLVIPSDTPSAPSPEVAGDEDGAGELGAFDEVMALLSADGLAHSIVVITPAGGFAILPDGILGPIPYSGPVVEDVTVGSGGCWTPPGTKPNGEPLWKPVYVKSVVTMETTPEALAGYVNLVESLVAAGFVKAPGGC